ncbi:MAG: CtsR family transcriptional regulator [Clostridia bacterium]|nr:CtsR family transcriptional regulator [Clostridia bacterium]
MLLSEHIAKLIEEMIEEGEGSTNVRRNDLAQRLGCVPSQVSYVISSRFTPERGYITESRRGGGGYIRIVRVPMSKDEYLMHFFQAIGTSLSENEAKAYVRNLLENEVISAREASVIGAAVSASALGKLDAGAANIIRADIMRHILMTLMR